uniref:Uncharacterized protein n=1 Tax=Maylandia zebra TaxID=106582 RepID=A0A3P9BIA0_9CICH
STLGSGSLHCVDLVRRPQRAQLCLVAWAAVQGVFWHADGKGQVATHAPDDDGGANVTGLYPHLPTDSGATSLCDGQAATFTATASPILKRQKTFNYSRGLNPTLCSKVSQNLFPPTSSHRNIM